MKYGTGSVFFLLLFLGSVQSLTAAQVTVHLQAPNTIPSSERTDSRFVSGCKTLKKQMKFVYCKAGSCVALLAAHMQGFSEWLQEEFIPDIDDMVDADTYHNNVEGTTTFVFDPDQGLIPLQQEESKVTIFKAAYAHRHGTPVPEEEQKHYPFEEDPSDEIHEIIEIVEEQQPLQTTVQQGSDVGAETEEDYELVSSNESENK